MLQRGAPKLGTVSYTHLDVYKRQANDNHLLSVPCYNGTMLTHDYYNEFFELGQQKINFSFFELSLPDDDKVYTCLLYTSRCV